MSLTFTLHGRKSILSENYYPPIELDPNFEYCIGLVGFYSCNTIQNVDKFNNTFVFRKEDGNTITEKVPPGAYEITGIEKYLQKKLGENVISMVPNNNTIKCEIKSQYGIDFTVENSMRKLLGFSAKYLEPNILHESDEPVSIQRVYTILIDCNVITGAYYGSMPSHTLFHFAPTTPPGYSINIEPSRVRYLKVNKHVIDNITLVILDQDYRMIDFNGEKIVVTLELKKYSEI